MKKRIAFAIFLLWNTAAFADPFSGSGYKHSDDAKDVKTNTLHFNGNLSGTDTDVQKALDTLDDLVTSSGGGTWGSITGTLSDQTDLQSALDAKLTSVTADSPLSGSGTSGSHLVLSTAGTWSGNAGTASALAANGGNCSAGSFPLGVDASGASESCTALPTTITGTANQITASAATGAVTLSIPTNPTLPGTTTGTFSGNLTGAVTGNASTATALAANGGNCSGNNFALGVDASGVGECSQPAFSNLSGSATDAQIPNNITVDLATTVTTDANLTGPITSVGNATSIAAQTGTGTTFVMQASPTITTASLGSSTATTQTQADNSTKLATTAYVDTALLGQNFKEACKYASTAALPTVVYDSGAGTLTGVALAAISLDSSSPSVLDRVLIKNQASTFQNGIYTVTATGSGIAVFVLTRTSDANAGVEFKTGDSVFVTSGTTLSSTTWAYTGIDGPNFTSDAISYVQVAGQGSFTGGSGIAITGTSIATASTEADFLASGALTCGAATQGQMKVHTTPLQYCDNAATPALQYAAYGSSTGVATSATALAANGANCSGNNFALGVDASGVGECAQPAFSNLSGAATDAQVPNTITIDLATTVTTNANLTGEVTSVGNAATIADSVTVTGWDLGASSAGTSLTSPIFKSNNADPADAGLVRLGNAELIEWEKATAGTDWTLGVNSSDVLITNAPFSVGTSNAITAGTIELGAATDTTLARSGAGAVTVEGTQVLLSGAALGTPSSGTATNITGLPEGGLSLTDIATNNSSTTKHGFLLKLNNSATTYMDGTGAWSTPGGSTAWDSIGDAVGNGTVAFGTTNQDITGAIDTASQYMLQLTNTDADAANLNYILQLAHNDSADAQAGYIKAISDADGTPATFFDMTSTATTWTGVASVDVASLPTFHALGTSAHGTGALTVSLPTHSANDILLLFVQTANEAVTAPAGWTQLGPQAGHGIAATALSNRLAIFWKRDNGSEADPITVADPGDHAIAYIISVTGCVTTGDPFQFLEDGIKTTASTTGTTAAYATFAPNSLVVAAFAHSIDSTTAVFSSWTNSSLTSFTERGDDDTTDGVGGGIGVAMGGMATPGALGATTVTETSTVDAWATFAMLPLYYNLLGVRARPAEIQSFVSRGTDTWTKPTAALSVRVQLIGGGGSGGGGRNAATAEGGGGGGGAMYTERTYRAQDLASSVSIVIGAGGAAPADTDGSTGNDGADSTFGTQPGAGIRAVKGKGGIGAISADGGDGGAGGGTTVPAAATLQTIVAGDLGAAGGTATTTSVAGSPAEHGGGGGESGADTDAAVAAGLSKYGGGGGGGGRTTGTITPGGAGGGAAAPTNTAGLAGTDSTSVPYGAAGGNSGNSTNRGGSGGFPGGGGGGGGSGSGTQAGGKGGDGACIVTSYF